MIRLGTRSYRWAAAVWALLMATLLLSPGSAFDIGLSLPPALQALVAWSVHFGLFWVLAWLVRRSFGTRGGFRRAAGARWWIVALAAYCIALESLQALVPRREFELLDIVFGGFGIWLGWRLGSRDAGRVTYTRAPDDEGNRAPGSG